jgi:hypothetical protein
MNEKCWVKNCDEPVVVTIRHPQLKEDKIGFCAGHDRARRLIGATLEGDKPKMQVVMDEYKGAK